MSLTCDKLMKFDLIESIEPNLSKETILKFFEITGEIENIDNFIRETPSFPGSTDKIIRDELISVIGGTLSIEGTFLEKDEIEESFIKAKKGEPLIRKEKEAENSRKVYEFIRDVGKRNGRDLTYSERLIKQVHKYFTEGMDYMSNVPGQYRTNFNVSFGYPRKQSLCITQSDIESAMKSFIIWLNQKTGKFMLSSHPLVKAIMAHYYLTEVHPFGDGNGRTARAIEALVLYTYGINDYCFWSLANFWSSHKDMYLSQLHNIRETQDPMDFLLWGLEGFRDHIKSIKNKVLKKVKQLMFSDYIQYLLRNKKYENIKLTQRIVDVLLFIISREKIAVKKFYATPEIIAFYANVSQSTKVRDFQKMLYHQLIKIELIEEEEFIRPNYGLLERLQYNI